MRPEDVGAIRNKHCNGQAFRSSSLAIQASRSWVLNWAPTNFKDVFVRFKALADRKKEIYDDDLIALMHSAPEHDNERLKIEKLAVRCGY